MLQQLDNEKKIQELGLKGVRRAINQVWIEGVGKQGKRKYKMRFSTVHWVFCFPTHSSHEELWELPIMAACGVQSVLR